MTKNSDEKKREKKRRLIMEAALKVFSKKGYSPAAVDEVAREASIAKGTLYLYFRDKEDLFFSTVIFFVDNLASYIQQNIDDSMTPFQILERLAYLQLNFFSQNRDVFGLFQTILEGKFLGDHKKLFKSLFERRKALINFASEVLERGKKKGLIRKDISTVSMVSSYIGMINFAINRICFQANPDDFDIDKEIRTIMKILLEGISSKHE